MVTRQSLKIAIARTLCHPIIGIALAKVHKDRFKVGATTILTDGPDVDPTSKASIFWGFYESAEIALISRYLQPDLDVVELGGSIGVVTSQIVSRLHPHVKVVTVEANPGLIPLLAANAEANASGGSITIVNRAVDYSKKGSQSQFQIATRSVASGVVAPGRCNAEALSISSITLQELTSTYGLQDYQLISDIEGAEAGMVYSDDPAWHGCRRAIVELHETRWANRKITPEDIIARLAEKHKMHLVDRIGNVCVFDRD